MIDVQLARTRQQLDRCLAMRRTVFTEELGVPPEVDVDGHDVLDGECLHFLVTDGGRDIGAIRCTPQEDGTVRLQRFCIHKDSRSHGAGRLTLRFLEGFFAGRGYHALCLDAKCSAEGFCLKCGYTAVSGVFEEAGVPHVAMRREL